MFELKTRAILELVIQPLQVHRLQDTVHFLLKFVFEVNKPDRYPLLRNVNLEFLALLLSERCPYFYYWVN